MAAARIGLGCSVERRCMDLEEGMARAGEAQGGCQQRNEEGIGCEAL